MFRIGDTVRIVLSPGVFPYKTGYHGEIIGVHPRLVSEETVYNIKMNDGKKMYFFASEMRFVNDEAIYS